LHLHVLADFLYDRRGLQCQFAGGHKHESWVGMAKEGATRQARGQQSGRNDGEMNARKRTKKMHETSLESINHRASNK
jgi:hypothetical protein